MLKRENHIEIDRRKFYKTVLALVVPMALQNLINVGVTAADVIMLGKKLYPAHLWQDRFSIL